MNTHYQIKFDELPEFLTIMKNKEFHIKLTPQVDIKDKTVLIHLPTESLLLSESAVMTLSEDAIKKHFNKEFNEMNFIKSYKCIKKNSNKSAKDRNSIRFDMAFSGRNSTYENITLFEKGGFFTPGMTTSTDKITGWSGNTLSHDLAYFMIEMSQILLRIKQ